MAQIPSFSPGQEDLLILYLSNYLKQGIYLELGASDPCESNATWLLYNHEWRGLCIPAKSSSVQTFENKRPRDETFDITSLECSVAKHMQSFAPTSIDLLSIHIDNPETLELMETLDLKTLQPKRILVFSSNFADTLPTLQKRFIPEGFSQVLNNRWCVLFTTYPTDDLQKLYEHQELGKPLPSLESKIRPVIPHEKTRQAWESRGYHFNPLITFIIQSHNKSDQVLHLAQKLQELDNTELIVIDDGSEIHHTEKLASHLTQGNQLLFRTNDLYEIITYDRAITLARGQLVVLMQDDDTFANFQWIKDAVNYFAEIPDLAILGGRNPIRMLPFEPEGDGSVGDYQVNGCIAHIPNLLRQNLWPDPNFPQTFQFSATVNRAPMWVHRGHFINHLKSIEQSYAPFQRDDAEICLRCWQLGLKVGWYPAQFQIQGIGTGGMRIWNNQLTREQSIRNTRSLYSVYGSELETINQKVDLANQAYWGESSI